MVAYSCLPVGREAFPSFTGRSTKPGEPRAAAVVCKASVRGVSGRTANEGAHHGTFCGRANPPEPGLQGHARSDLSVAKRTGPGNDPSSPHPGGRDAQRAFRAGTRRTATRIGLTSLSGLRSNPAACSPLFCVTDNFDPAMDEPA